MKLIKLTSINNTGDIYVNVEHIGHMYEVKEKISYGRVEVEAHTVVGVVTHNNGGFRVKETVKLIVKAASQ
jgi:hypothetical protein